MKPTNVAQTVREVLMSPETVRDVYAGGPYGKVRDLVDQGITPLTAELSEDVYRRVIEAAVESLASLEDQQVDEPEEGGAQKEMAWQAFQAGAELFAGSDLEPPVRQFERFWEQQLDYAIDAEGDR